MKVNSYHSYQPMVIPSIFSVNNVHFTKAKVSYGFKALIRYRILLSIFYVEADRNYMKGSIAILLL